MIRNCKRTKYIGFWCVLFIMLYLFIEATSLAALYTLDRLKDVRYAPIRMTLTELQKKYIVRLLSSGDIETTIHPFLGWIPHPNFVKEDRRHNAQGIRANKEYGLQKSPDTIRIAVFGDSFTYGKEVGNDETWPANLEKLDPHLDVINFGVNGYGIDQAYLRYILEGKTYNPDIVILAFIMDNTARNVNVFRPWKVKQNNAEPLSKPRFILENGEPVYYPPPLKTHDDYKQLLLHDRKTLKSFAANDYFVHIGYIDSLLSASPLVRILTIGYSTLLSMSIPGRKPIFQWGQYASDAPSFSLSLEIIDAFVQEVRANGSIPVLVFLPTADEILQWKTHDTVPYQSFLNALEHRQYELIHMLNELKEYFKTDHTDQYFLSKHYTPETNAKIAEAILRILRERGLLPSSRTE